MKILWIILISIVSLSPLTAQAVDDTTCFVRNDCDDAGNIDAANCLRHKIENGYNKKIQRACVDRIVVVEGIKNITLKKPLVIDNERDEDCEGDSPLCGDDWGLIIDGNGVDIDVSKVTGECGITLKSHGVQINNLNLVATGAQVSGNKVICDQGNHNEMNVTINGRAPEPEASPTPSPTPIPTPTAAPTPPAAPSDLTGTVTGDSPDFIIVLEWTDHAGDEDGFRVERAMVATGETDCGDFSQLKSTGADTATAGDDAVEPGTIYCYRVFAVKGDLNSDNPSNVVQVEIPAETATPQLPAPTGLTASEITDQTLKLTWDYDETIPITGFRLERGNGDCEETSFTQIGLLGDTIREFVDTDLSPETGYCYRLEAYALAAASDSDYSETVTALTLEDDGLPPVDPEDVDGDGFQNPEDNCPEKANPNQEDFDGDEMGDACDDDDDGDGVSDDEENAQGTNPLDMDSDHDGPTDDVDNCPTEPNADQADADGDGIGNACDQAEEPDPKADNDQDGILNGVDNCPAMANPDQSDQDQDGQGDACDLSPSVNATSGGCSLVSPESASRTIPFLALGWLLMAGAARSFMKRRD